MTPGPASAFLSAFAAEVPFPLTCFLELPAVRWEKSAELKERLGPLLSRFWEIQPLTGGDSFFFYQGAGFLDWCRGLGATVTLAAPLERMSEERAGTMVAGRLHRLILSIAGDLCLPPAAEQTAAALATAVETLRRRQAEKGTALPRLRLEVAGRAAGPLIALARSLGISEIAGGEERASGGGQGLVNAASSPGGWRHFLKSRLVKEYRFDDLFSSSSLRAEGGRRKDCLFPWNAARITRQMEVMPCPVSSRVMGRLGEDSFEAIWNGAAYRDLRRGLLSDSPPAECRSCRLQGWFAPHRATNWIRAGINDRFGVQLGTGWHEREEGRPYRWSRKEAVFLLRNAGGKKLKLVLHLPSGKLAQEGEVFINGEKAGGFRLRRPGDHLLAYPLPPGARPEILVRLACRRPIVPRDLLGNDDLRRLGVAWKGAFLDQ